MECVLAPGYDPGALGLLQQKKNLRLLELPDVRSSDRWALKQVSGGLVVQSPDDETEPGLEEEAFDAEALGAVVPDYPSPDGIPPRTLRGFVERAVRAYADLVPSHLPDPLSEERGRPSVSAALREIQRSDAKKKETP